MGLFQAFVSQTRKPEGFLGKMMVRGMNSGHAKLADWGFTHLPAITPERAVDLGCGGGRNAGELLKMYPKAHIMAVDYSELSVEKAKAYNKAMITAGRCTVRQGDVSDLQLPVLDMRAFQKKHKKEYEAMVKRTPSVGSMKDNMSAARNAPRNGNTPWTGSSISPMTLGAGGDCCDFHVVKGTGTKKKRG